MATATRTLAPCGSGARRDIPVGFLPDNIKRAPDGTLLVTGSGNALVDYACGALQVGDTLYITVRGDRRIAYQDLSYTSPRPAPK